MASKKAQLPADWAQRVAASLAGSVGATDCTVSVTLLAGPDGDASATFTASDGTVAASNELVKDADLALQVPWSDAAAVFEGQAEPAVLYMQGKLKSTGDNQLLLQLLAKSADAEHASWRSAVYA